MTFLGDDADEFLHKIPVLGGLFPNPKAKKKTEMLRQMALAYQAQRPELAQSQTNALNQTLGAYAPANNMLGQMYGQGAMVDLEALGQNPMTPGYMNPGVGQISKLQDEIDKKRGTGKYQFAPKTSGTVSLDNIKGY